MDTDLTARLDAWMVEAKAFLAHPERYDPNELVRLLAMVDDLLMALHPAQPD